MSIIFFTHVASPVGPLLLAAEGQGLLAIRFARKGQPARPEAGWREDRGRFDEVARQLELYFAGRLRDFALELAPRGTPFQLEVWESLRRIPYGRTISYGELARYLGRPAASRAVGAANGRNPLPIVVPCHRVIGAGGELTGFGGGLEIKRALLELEGALAPERRALPFQPA